MTPVRPGSGPNPNSFAKRSLLKRDEFSGAALLSQLTETWGPTEISQLPEKIRALAADRDPQSFFQGLLHLGAHLEGQDRYDLAGNVYSVLISDVGAPPPSPSLIRRGKGEVPLRVYREAEDRLLWTESGDSGALEIGNQGTGLYGKPQQGRLA